MQPRLLCREASTLREIGISESLRKRKAHLSRRTVVGRCRHGLGRLGGDSGKQQVLSKARLPAQLAQVHALTGFRSSAYQGPPEALECFEQRPCASGRLVGALAETRDHIPAPRRQVADTHPHVALAHVGLLDRHSEPANFSQAQLVRLVCLETAVGRPVVRLVPDPSRLHDRQG